MDALKIHLVEINVQLEKYKILGAGFRISPWYKYLTKRAIFYILF